MKTSRFFVSGGEGNHWKLGLYTYPLWMSLDGTGYHGSEMYVGGEAPLRVLLCLLPLLAGRFLGTSLVSYVPEVGIHSTKPV